MVERDFGDVELPNRVPLLTAVRLQIVEVALRSEERVYGAPRVADVPDAAPPPPPSRISSPRPSPTSIDRPVFVVSSPRSGSTLLFETLALAPGLLHDRR